jgi:hypothetical protein
MSIFSKIFGGSSSVAETHQEEPSKEPEKNVFVREVQSKVIIEHRVGNTVAETRLYTPARPITDTEAIQNDEQYARHFIGVIEESMNSGVIMGVRFRDEVVSTRDVLTVRYESYTSRPWHPEWYDEII